MPQLQSLEDGKYMCYTNSHCTETNRLFTYRFLLKYASRDEVDILGRGNGGIVEVRNAIAQFEEESPLFGYLRYRRRNVLIKYVPENCSRLIQGKRTQCVFKTDTEFC